MVSLAGEDIDLLSVCVPSPVLLLLLSWLADVECQDKVWSCFGRGSRACASALLATSNVLSVCVLSPVSLVSRFTWLRRMAWSFGIVATSGAWFEQLYSEYVSVGWLVVGCLTRSLTPPHVCLGLFFCVLLASVSRMLWAFLLVGWCWGVGMAGIVTVGHSHSIRLIGPLPVRWSRGFFFAHFLTLTAAL